MRGECLTIIDNASANGVKLGTCMMRCRRSSPKWCWLMAAKTIAERLCQTKCMAARHILQDEAAMVGAQGVVSEDLEARLTQAEAKDLLSKEYTPMTYHGVQDVSSEHVEAKARCPKTADPLNKEYRPIRCAES